METIDISRDREGRELSASPPPRLTLVIIAVVGILLFAIRVSLPSVASDRGFQLYGPWVLDAVQNGHWLAPVSHTGALVSKPPLFVGMAALATWCAGRLTVLTVVLPSGLATLLTALLIGAAGRAFFGGAVGLLAALAFLVSPSGAAQVTLARPDAVFSLAVTAAALAALRAWLRGDGWTWFWLAAAVATLAKGPLGVLLAAGGLLAALWERAGRRSHPVWGRQAPGIALFLLVTLGWLALAYLEMGQPLLDRMLIGELLGHATGRHDGRRPGQDLLIPPALFMVTFAPWSLLTVARLWRAWRRPPPDDEERRVERFLVCWFLAALVAFAVAPHQHERLLFPLMPPAALLAGRELARAFSWLPPGRLLAGSSAAAALGLAVVGVAYHYVLDGSDRAVHTRGMQELARSIHARVGEAFPLVHVDSPVTLQLFLNRLTPLASPRQAADLLSGSDPVFVAVRDLPALQAASARPLIELARWPASGEPYVRVVSNHPRLEWTDPHATFLDPLVLRLHGMRLLHVRGPELLLRRVGPPGIATVTNTSASPRLVRARVLHGAAVPMVEERWLLPGTPWQLAAGDRAPVTR
jgi:4-amino-4-deoxy-L-arabinose transferase-like glycosyltransferase